MLSWFIAMLINQNQDKVCSSDWVSPWEVFKMIMIAQAGEQDIFTKKRGLANCLFGRRQNFPEDSRDGSAEQPRPQTLKRAHEDVHPHRCTRAPTLMAGLALSPEMLDMPLPEGLCFPRVFITAAAEGNMLGSYCLHLPRDNCLNRAGIQRTQGSPDDWTIWAVCPEPWFSPTMWGWAPWSSSLLSTHPGTMSWEETLLPSYDILEVFNDWFQRSWNTINRFCWDVFSWNFLKIKGALEKSPFKVRDPKDCHFKQIHPSNAEVNIWP